MILDINQSAYNCLFICKFLYETSLGQIKESKMKKKLAIAIFVLSVCFGQDEVIHISKTYPDGTPKEVIKYMIMNTDLKTNQPFYMVEKILYDKKGNLVERKNSKKIDLTNPSDVASAFLTAIKNNNLNKALTFVNKRERTNVLKELKSDGFPPIPEIITAKTTRNNGQRAEVEFKGVDIGLDLIFFNNRWWVTI
jgi:hypothetical protein